MPDRDRATDGPGGTDGRTTRRHYLAALGVAATTATAGCNLLGGGGDSGDGGTTGRPLTTVAGAAQFARFSVEGPAEVTVGDPATFTMSAVNVGGEAGDFTGTLGVVEGAATASATVSLEDVAPGSRARTDVEVTFRLADDLVVGVGEAEVEAERSVTVVPVTGDVGAELALDGLRATLTGTTVRSSVYRYREDTVEGVYAPTDDRVLMVVRLDLENAATEPRTLRLDRLEPSAGSFLATVDGGGLGALTDVSGRPVADATVEPAQTRSGWLLAQVPRTAVREGFEVHWQRDAAGTPPERVWTVPGTEALPDLRLVEWTLPGTTEQGTTTYTVTVENAGSAPGTVRGLVERGGPNASADRFRPRSDFHVTLDAGERRTVELETEWLFATERAYRLQPFGERRVVDFQPYQATFGETVSLPQQVSMRIGNPRFADEVTLRSFGNDETYTPENGQFLVVDGFADAPGNPANSPEKAEFSASVEGAGTYGRLGALGELVEPYEGRRQEIDLRELLNPDGVEFVLVFDVPADATAETVTVRWDDGYTEGRSSVRWRQS